MGNKARKREEEFTINCEVKQQITDIVAITTIFFVAMLCGKICMDKYGETWFAFNLPTIVFASIGLYMWCHLRDALKKQ